MRRAPSGFTLVEVLLASALTAVIGLAIAQVVGVSHRADKRVKERAARRAAASAIARRLEGDLRGLVPPGGLYAAGLVLLAGDRTGGAAEALLPAGLDVPTGTPVAGEPAPPPVDARDQLTLAVAPPPVAWGDALPAGEGAFHHVVYEVDDDAATPERGLVRRVVRLRDPVPGAPAEPVEVLAAAAVGLEVRCWDGTAWQGAWDSGSSDTLPTAVQVRVALLEGTEVVTVPLVVAPRTAWVSATATTTAGTGAAAGGGAGGGQ